VLKEATGEDLSTRAMVDYFQPLMAWLEEQNKGRKIGWGDDKEQSPEEKEREEHEPGKHDKTGDSSEANTKRRVKIGDDVEVVHSRGVLPHTAILGGQQGVD